MKKYIKSSESISSQRQAELALESVISTVEQDMNELESLLGHVRLVLDMIHSDAPSDTYNPNDDEVFPAEQYTSADLYEDVRDAKLVNNMRRAINAYADAVYKATRAFMESN